MEGLTIQGVNIKLINGCDESKIIDFEEWKERHKVLPIIVKDKVEEKR